MNDKSQPTQAHDHMTVAHIQQTIETRPQQNIVEKHLTTAHLADALVGAAAQPAAAPAPASASVPASPPSPKREK
jgi:hypothetical protein